MFLFEKLAKCDECGSVVYTRVDMKVRVLLFEDVSCNAQDEIISCAFMPLRLRLPLDRIYPDCLPLGRSE